jgi:hypothetical protein
MESKPAPKSTVAINFPFLPHHVFAVTQARIAAERTKNKITSQQSLQILFPRSKL